MCVCVCVCVCVCLCDIKGVNPNVLNTSKIYTRNIDFVVYIINFIMMESINNHNIDRENPLCLSFSEVDACIIEESENKYLIFALTKNC